MLYLEFGLQFYVATLCLKVLMRVPVAHSNPNLDSRHHWRRVMQGHAGANMVPIVASNRVGTEDYRVKLSENQDALSRISFYGTSFITDATGCVVAELQQQDGAFVCANVSCCCPVSGEHNQF